MWAESEHSLENRLLAFLIQTGYDPVDIKSMEQLKENHIRQICQLNQIDLSDDETKRYFTQLNQGNVFARAERLRDKIVIQSDDSAVKNKYIRLIDTQNPEKNIFQVVSQPEVHGKKGKNIYDVVILINGLPLVHIELKRKGIHYGEAEEQLLRYYRDSLGAEGGLFLYTQLYIVSNDTETRYFANNTKLNKLFHFTWAKEDNSKVNDLFEFAGVFLNPQQLFRFITNYVVLKKKTEQLYVLRPYQFYAVERIIEKVKENSGNGYIWHTTGSGKTLTSFKASQIITRIPEVKKVVFVVDRKDLDEQTAKEFNAYSPESVDLTANTKKLVERLEGDTRLIVTTIQKLNYAISTPKYKKRIESLRDERIVFIFDECHRSQFGLTHRNITKFFRNTQLFGFTGTPIFAENAYPSDGLKRTTKDLFGDCLHKYVITDAISDGNVLRFSVEYIGRFIETNSTHEQDIAVQDIDTSEVFDTQDRLEKIYSYIIKNHNRKVGNNGTAIFAVSSIDVLCRYYEIFKKGYKKDHNLKVATVFSYADNDTFIKDSDWGGVDDPNQPYGRQNSERLTEYVKDFNGHYGTNESIKDSKAYDSYFRALSSRVKAGEVDILLVVNMFLTGFDSPKLTTLYVDKNLKHHGLIQAFSRTNRLLDASKPQGNIVCFRNLKPETDEAVALFSSKEANEVIFTPSYEEQLESYLLAVTQLLDIAPVYTAVDDLISENDKKTFIEAFKRVMVAYNKVKHYDEFDLDKGPLTARELTGFKDKYAALRDSIVMQSKEKESILGDIDFKMELLQVDEINVDYILRLIGRIKVAAVDKRESLKQDLMIQVGADERYRSKLELIKKFIADHLDGLDDNDNIDVAFADYVQVEKERELNDIALTYTINPDKLAYEVTKHTQANQKLDGATLIDLMDQRPSLFKLESVSEQLLQRVTNFINVFSWVA